MDVHQGGLRPRVGELRRHRCFFDSAGVGGLLVSQTVLGCIPLLYLLHLNAFNSFSFFSSPMFSVNGDGGGFSIFNFLLPPLES